MKTEKQQESDERNLTIGQFHNLENRLNRQGQYNIARDVADLRKIYTERKDKELRNA